MEFRKIFWGIRGVFYKISFRHIGKLCYIGPPVSIIGKRNIVIKDRVRIYPGIRMEALNNGTITIGNNVSIAQNFQCTSIGDLRIEDNVTIAGNVFVTNIDHDYQEWGRHILEQNKIFKETHIGENCFIGYGAAIQAGTILGKQCVVGANSVVRGTFPDGSVIVGAPAKIVKKFNANSNQWEKTESGLL